MKKQNPLAAPPSTAAQRGKSGYLNLKKQNLTVAITGASGAGYARKLLRSIPRRKYDVHLASSEAGRLVYELETGVALSDDLPPEVCTYEETDFAAPLASGRGSSNRCFQLSSTVEWSRLYC